MGRWDQLPFDLLRKIDEHLELYPDKVRSKCVCTHWERAFPKLPDLRNQPPWLLLPFTNGSLCGLFHPFKKNMFVIDLPEAGEKVCKGSDHGWVVTVQMDGSINVVNPLTRARFALPPRYKFTDVLNHRPKKVGDEYLFRALWDESGEPGVRQLPPFTLDAEHVRNNLIKKIALSCAPSRGDDFRAVAIYGETDSLAYCKLGDKKWTDLVELNNGPYSYKDITFCGGKLYTLNHRLQLLVCDDIVSCPKLRKLLPACKGFGGRNTEMHLINSSDGGIMVVRRKRLPHHLEVQNSESQESEFIHKTSDFEIYRVRLTTSPGWIRKKSLAYEILFMGMGKQVGIRRKKGNKIYFTSQELSFDGQDIKDCFEEGIFSFKDKEITKSLGYESDPRMIFPSPIWVMPNPY